MSEIEKIKVLDHGYISIVETWGSDEAIVAAARMSTDKGFLGWGTPEKPGDEKLLKYLYSNRHDSPFEMAGAIIEVQAPIFVFREWQRHRTQGYNELSGRYTSIPDVNYIPSLERLMMNSNGANKQAGTIAGAEALTEDAAKGFQEELRGVYGEAEHLYQRALQCGVPKELARVHIPVGRYSRMRATSNLRNWMGFLSLRSEKNLGAQWEIRQFANVLAELLAAKFPRTFDLFNNGTR